MKELNFILEKEVEKVTVDEKDNVFAGNYKFSTQNTVVYDNYCYVITESSLLKIYTKCDKLFYRNGEIALVRRQTLKTYKNFVLCKVQEVPENAIYNDFPDKVDNKENIFVINGVELLILPDKISFGSESIKNPIHIEDCRYFVAFYDKITIIGNDKSLDFVYFYDQKNVEPNDNNRLSLRIDDNFEEIKLTDAKFFGSDLYLIDHSALKKYKVKDLPTIAPPTKVIEYIACDYEIVLKESNNVQNNLESPIVNDLPDIEKEITSIFYDQSEAKGYSAFNQSLERLQDHISKSEESQLFSKDLDTLLEECGANNQDVGKSDESKAIGNNLSSENQIKDQNLVSKPKEELISSSKPALSEDLKHINEEEKGFNLSSAQNSSFLQSTKNMFSPSIQSALSSGTSWLKKQPSFENNDQKMVEDMPMAEKEFKKDEIASFTDQNKKLNLESGNTKTSLFAPKFDKFLDSVSSSDQSEKVAACNADQLSSGKTCNKVTETRSTDQVNPEKEPVFQPKKSGIFTKGVDSFQQAQLNAKSGSAINEDSESGKCGVDSTFSDHVTHDSAESTTSVVKNAEVGSVAGKIKDTFVPLSERRDFIDKFLNVTPKTDKPNENIDPVKPFVRAVRPRDSNTEVKASVLSNISNPITDNKTVIETELQKSKARIEEVAKVGEADIKESISRVSTTSHSFSGPSSDKAFEKSQLELIETDFNEKLQEVKKMFAKVTKEKTNVPVFELIPSCYDLNGLYNLIFNNNFTHYEETLSSMIVYLDQVNSIDACKIEESIKYFEHMVLERSHIKKPIKYSNPIPLKLNDIVKTSSPVDDLISGVKVLSLQSSGLPPKFTSKSISTDDNAVVNSTDNNSTDTRRISEPIHAPKTVSNPVVIPKPADSSPTLNKASGFLNMNRPAINPQQQVINNSYQECIDYNSHPLLVKDSTSLFNSIANDASLDPRLVGGAPAPAPTQLPEPQNPGQPMSILARLAASKRMFQGN